MHFTFWRVEGIIIEISNLQPLIAAHVILEPQGPMWAETDTLLWPIHWILKVIRSLNIWDLVWYGQDSFIVFAENTNDIILYSMYMICLSVYVFTELRHSTTSL